MFNKIQDSIEEIFDEISDAQGEDDEPELNIASGVLTIYFGNHCA